MNILITGCAGFIGYHVSNKLLNENHHIYGIDNLNNYYDVKLKQHRLKNLKKFKNFYFKKIDIQKINQNDFLRNIKIDTIINLAAQAGVRLSESNPRIYLNSNINGFLELILFAKTKKIKKFIYASSSSVYGDLNKKTLFESKIGKAKSFYGLTKQFNEKIADFYANEIKFIGLRFFTVYGPYGRPDMAVYKFTKALYEKKTIKLYNKGENLRDFTYIDDLVNVIFKILKSNYLFSYKNYILNLGFSNPVSTNKLLRFLENETSRKAKKIFVSENKLDLINTKASTKKIEKHFGKINNVKLSEGIKRFVKWYEEFYKPKKW